MRELTQLFIEMALYAETGGHVAKRPRVDYSTSVAAAAGGGAVQEGALQQVHRGLVPALLQPGNMDTQFKHLL